MAAPIVVLKFGGTSVGSVARIHHVATLAMAAQRSGKRVVVVVSAMSGETNRLLGLAAEVSEHASNRERDVLAASGEQASSALTAIAIQAAGGKARSFLGHQIPLTTDGVFADARVRHVEPKALLDSLARGEIPVVAGFQGIDKDGNITTLGRGGSDTTAVALAAALKAESCEIYTDVDGVYTADPNIVPSARKLARVSYQYMLTFAALGAKVLHDRCVELAQEFGVPVHVRTSFGDTPGTMITPDGKDDGRVAASGLALDMKLTHVYGRAGGKGLPCAMLSAALAERGSTVVEVIGAGHEASLVIRQLDISPLKQVLRSGEFPLVCLADIARVSVVGTGFKRDPRIKTKAMHLITGFGIALQHMTESDASLSFYVPHSAAADVMRILHDGMAIGVGEEHGAAAPSPGRRR